MDSGSYTSFIEEHLASSLIGVVPLPRPCRVKVDDGGELCCVLHILPYSWTLLSHEFVTDMKVFPLGAYNAILGTGWLKITSH